MTPQRPLPQRYEQCSGFPVCLKKTLQPKLPERSLALIWPHRYTAAIGWETCGAHYWQLCAAHSHCGSGVSGASPRCLRWRTHLRWPIRTCFLEWLGGQLSFPARSLPRRIKQYSVAWLSCVVVCGLEAKASSYYYYCPPWAVSQSSYPPRWVVDFVLQRGPVARWHPHPGWVPISIGELYPVPPL